ncbi:MAG: MBL fold metallo-hydrolase [Firmicutes bacterium]|nr:MBL fold metallo-hydrolase [Bacillota bacterium]
MKITILGTGNAQVTECYNTCFVLSDGDRHFMVDGGGGNTILRQLKLSGLKWQDMRDIFLTHKHLDHIMGIVWMMRMICQNISRGNYEGEARIYGHGEVLEILRDLAEKLLDKKDFAHVGKSLHLIEVKDGESLEIIGKKVTFFDIGSTKAKQFGFSMELGGGEKLTCCGDEPFAECERAYAENSKWLLSEAFCLYGERAVFKPYEKHHSTVKEACELAAQLNVPNLILYHTEDRNIRDRKRLYTEEGKAFYHGNLFVPDDLEVLEL